MKKALIILATLTLAGCQYLPDGWTDNATNAVPVVTTTTTTTTTTTQPGPTTFPVSERNNAVEDVTHWDETVQIRNVRFESPGIKWDYVDGTNQNQERWKMTNKSKGERLNGTLCALIDKDGTLYQCNLDSLRPGMDYQTMAPFKSHGNLIKPPLNGWRASRGERLGIYITGVNWVYGVGTRERSNLVWVEYP